MFEPSKLKEIVGEPVALRTPLEEWRQQLLKAAELIRKHGWTQFTQLGRDGSLCLHGAISLAVHGVPGFGADQCNMMPALKAALERRGEYGYRNNTGLAPWNNRPERTASDVISLLEDAATYQATNGSGSNG